MWKVYSSHLTVTKNIRAKVYMYLEMENNIILPHTDLPWT